MARIVLIAGALQGLKRCHRFLEDRSPDAATRAGQIISEHFDLLTIQPEMGRPLSDTPEIRELMIGFGDSGYVALYRWIPGDDTVHVLAFRHQREAGY